MTDAAAQPNTQAILDLVAQVTDEMDAHPHAPVKQAKVRELLTIITNLLGYEFRKDDT